MIKGARVAHLSSSVGPCGVIESSSQPSPMTCGLPVFGFLCSRVSLVTMYLQACSVRDHSARAEVPSC